MENKSTEQEQQAALHKTDVIRCGVCLDCDFEDELSAFDEDVEYDEFWGREHKYYICPKCGGGVETHSHHSV